MTTTIQQIPAIIKRAVRTGANVKMTGHPGIGKTQIIEQTVREIQQTNSNFKLWVMYTPAMSPLDFIAVVPNHETGKLETYSNSALPNAYTDPDVEGIVFLGEVDNADPSTNKPLLKYINNEDLGGLQKPKGVIVVSDSNCLDHKSGVIQQPLSLVSRSRNVDVICDPDEVLKYFNSIGVSPFISAFLSIRKECVDTFAKTLEKRIYGPWANPRAWERLSKAIIDADLHNEKLTDEEIIGDIGEAVGREFIGFMTAARVLVTYEKIVKSPEKAKMPEQMSDIYAVIAMVATSAKAEHFTQVRTYVERFPLEIQILFHRLLATSKTVDLAAISRTDAYKGWFKDNKSLVDAILN